MTDFTPLQALAGGALIGLSAALLMLLHGRIAGITGVLSGLLPPVAPDTDWRVAFVAGLVASPLVYLLLFGSSPSFSSPAGLSSLALGGLIVGVGVSLGSGCTSGHGVCGLSRLSPRSVVAVLCFMGTAAATVFLIRHVFGSVA